MSVSLKDYLFVGIQFLLFGAYLLEFSHLTLNFPDNADIFTLIFAGFGVIIIIVSMLQLNKNLSPFPTPKNDSELVLTGLFKFVRHPIYSGILITTFFLAIYLNSGYKLIIVLLLGILFYYKSSYEEVKLRKKFPYYESYRASTGRFFPRF